MLNNFIKKYWTKSEVLLHIVPYRGYRSADVLFMRGRVLQYRDVDARLGDSIWRNALNNYRRFESDEVPFATIKATFGEQNWELQTNQEGYFQLNAPLQLAQHISTSVWQNVHLDLLTDSPLTPHVRATGEVMLPSSQAQFGVISDLDDTIIKTHVVSKTKMLYYTFFKNAYSRLAFDGTPALYWALRKGINSKLYNPIFYVSNSPCNLYDMLAEFIKYNNLPKAPILLRDIAIDNARNTPEYANHKRNSVLQILKTYPNLKFVLIGDSGELDADIYTDVSRLFPNQIIGIYIRAVNDPYRNERVNRLLARQDHTDTLLFYDSLQFAQHAAKQGLINTQWQIAIAETMRNHQRSDIIETLIDEFE